MPGFKGFPQQEVYTLTAVFRFNVFGPRQHPNGAYAAVIPRWVAFRELYKRLRLERILLKRSGIKSAPPSSIVPSSGTADTEARSA